MVSQRPIVDRKPHFDDESRNYGIRRLFADPEPREVSWGKRIWTPRLSGPLNQGNEGRCVIFGWGARLAATPIRYPVDNFWCNQKWPLVQAHDRRMGNHWSDGASVLAGAKACVDLNTVGTYYWCFGINQVTEGVARKGPVLLGINWYEDMYETDVDGLVHIGGPLVGGHCIMLNGWWPRHPKFGDCFVWTNSWGHNYGHNGRGFIKKADLDRLLREDGEACLPTEKAVKM
jgi:hypothetical protein